MRDKVDRIDIMEILFQIYSSKNEIEWKISSN